jgi:hypothetical protein
VGRNKFGRIERLFIKIAIKCMIDSQPNIGDCKEEGQRQENGL